MPVAQQMPPLANYTAIRQYDPSYGDVVIWSGWFSCWFGVVTDYDTKSSNVSIIFGGLPVLLFGMPQEDHGRNTKVLPLSLIRNERPGTFTVIKHDYGNNTNVWYV